MKTPNKAPRSPAAAATVKTTLALPDVNHPKKVGGRVAAVDGGGTGRQSDRRRELREFFAEQYQKAKRNPVLRFKNSAELAADFEVDEKTLRTDISYLRIVESLPIERIRTRGGWGFTEEVKAFAGDEFTRSEYLALWLSVQSFEAWGGLPHQKKMPSIMRKLKATAAVMDPDQLKRMRQCITFKAGGFQAPVEQGTFDEVMKALLNREELDFGYVSLTRRREALACQERGKIGEQMRLGAVAPASSAEKMKGCSVLSAEVFGEPEPRRVQPLHLLCWEYAWYLFAWDYGRQDTRTFALGRMSSVASTKRNFEPAVKFDLRKELSKSFGITRGKKAVQVHLRFRDRAIPLVIERLWHPTQEMIENEDNTLDLTMQVAITPELVRWVQSWGSDCVVLGPVSLDDDVLEDARRKLEEAARRRGIEFEIRG